MRIGSLFAGIGGLELGLERAGVGSVAWQCEIDPYARAVLAKHWPDAQRFEDVTKMRDVPPVDVICGGFPCQDISNAGRREGIGGARSGLFYELMRVVRLVRPRFVVLENVAALLGRGMGDVLGELSESGFDAEWDCIPASAVGAPHQRDRVFIIGYANGNSESALPVDAEVAVMPRDVADAVRDRRDGRPHEQERESERGDSSDAWQGGAVADANHARLEGRHMRWNAGSPRPSFVARRWAISREWLPEPDVGRVAHGVPSRVDRLKCLGNAVVPQVAEVVGRRLLAIAGAVT